MAQYRDNYKYTYITTGATTQVETGQGCLVRITINKTTTGTIKIIDDISGSTANIGIIAAGTLPMTLDYSIQVVKGVRIINSATEDITVVTSKLPS